MALERLRCIVRIRSAISCQPNHCGRRTDHARRFLLVACLFLGCGGDDGVSDYAKMIQSEQQAADHIKQAGGEAVKKNYPLGEGWAIKLSGATITDEIFTSLKRLGAVAELDLSGSNITDAQMQRVAEVGGVTFKLDLSRTAITDAGLAPLSDLSLLMELNLKGSKVTPAAAEQFRTMRQANPKALEFARKGTKVSI